MDAGLANNLQETVLPVARHPRRRAAQTVLWQGTLAIILANSAIIVWLWLQGGGIAHVRNAADLYTSIGRITGLISAYLALIQVLLLARLPWIERVTGFDRLTIWHRLNGKICLILVLAHVVFITIGYTLTDRFTLPHEIGELLGNYPGMIAAVIGTALLIAVVVTSLVLVRRRLSYGAWYAVHLMAYAGIALAWVHQIPTGNELAANQVAAAYWNALYVVTAALLVLCRIVQPLANAFRYRLRVDEVIVESPTVVSLRITGRRLDRLQARAGQFFLWRFLTRGCWWEAHPFSLSAAPDGRALRITVKHAGDFTRRIGAIKPGTRVIAEGPFGVFTTAAQKRDRVALIAGGIGITPIRALLEEMSGDLVVLYRVLRAEDAIFRHELDELARRRGFTIIYVIGDHAGPDGSRLLSAEHLRTLVPDIATRQIFLCGPPAMVQAVETHLRHAGVPGKAIHAERFAF